MDFLKKLDYKSFTTSQWIGISIGTIVLLYIAVSIASTALSGIAFPQVPSLPPMAVAPSMGYGGGNSYDSMQGSGASYSVASQPAADYAYGKGEPELSARNVAVTSPYPPSNGTTGSDAEAYEVTQYSAEIETRRLESACGAFDELKKRPDVIFENSNKYDRGCNFTFKVEHAKVDEVLAWLKAMNPKSLNDNTYTIKNQVEDFTSETDILTNKRASIDETMTKALSAYDEISRLATNSQNADALAKIIDSKIQLIERLTQQRIDINSQLDRLARSKAQELDRLDYTYFYVNVYENRYIDTKALGDSWKQAVRDFVQNFSRLLQELTIGLVLFLLSLVQWLIYGFIALLVAKYGWRFVRNFWNK